MIVKDIKYGEKFSIKCKIRNDKIKIGDEGFIIYSNDKLLFYSKDCYYEIENIETDKTQSLETNFTRGYENFAYILNKKNNKYMIIIVFFAGIVKDFISDISIAYNEDNITSLGKRGIKESYICDYLLNECVININNNKYIMLFNKFYTDEDNILDNKKEDIENQNDFIILGKSLNLFIKKGTLESNNYYYFINKIVFNKSDKHREYSPILVKFSNIFFKNKIEMIKPFLDNHFQKIIDNKNNKAYIKVWEKYTELERKNTLEKAKCILKCVKSENDGHNVIKCSFSNSIYFNKVKPGEQLIFVDNILEYINKIPNEPTIDELSDILSLIKDTQNIYQNNILYEVKEKKDDNTIIIEKGINKNEDLTNRYAIISLKGEITQLERKVEAIKNIKEGKSANPMLRFLIEGADDFPLKNCNIKKIKPLSNNMLNKVFKNNKPTENQIEAIEIALNTPDIALIQGPPGTGKTTVINAILERLNEEYYKDSNINAGNILITAFQHDAVNNIISKLKINAIPGIKFGGKIDAENKLSDELEDFCNSISEKISNKYSFTHDENVKKINKLSSLYEQEPTKNNTLNLLKFMLNLDSLNITLKENIKKQIEIFEKRKFNSENDFKLNTIYAIRVDENSFLDDGKFILSELEQKYFLNDDDKKIIEKIKKADPSDIKSYLGDLRIIKERLLDYYSIESEYKINKVNSNIITLVEQVKSELFKNTPIKDQVSQIVFDFKQKIDNDKDSVITSLKKYTIAYASTIQQSCGYDVKKHKKLFSKNAYYDVVIVDEAARSNPMDLFVALEQGRNKIILVGDHRQLPHIIDEEIKEQLEQGNQVKTSFEKNEDLLEISIFEYLLNNIKKLQEKDNIRRIITLNTQYRTHNILGDFINKNFYEPYNEKFISPRKYTEFRVGIPDIKKPCVWYNINKGEEKKDKKGSRYNDSEIEVIKKELKKWIKAGEIKENIGIISFYKTQVEKIKISLQKDESIDSLIKYNQIEIGTVDAFQGKEFDIIILSLVRCGSYNNKKNNEALFGHLTSKNRLCVAMSRAKRSLILVGNINFMSSKEAKEAVPALYDFTELCKSENGEIINV